ncbi:MAG TPA: isoamylase early set domain-containing protein [Candidatus Ozemobacteraceae bacterium]|nr:isoamylase early set domain-containing protein [Candidatus Ozemobacteraceae bacterium]
MITLFRWLWKLIVLGSAFGIGYIIGREHSFEEEEEWEAEEEERKEAEKKDAAKPADAAPAAPATGGAEKPVAFAYENAAAKTVSIVGDFNDWNKDKNPLTLENGVWKTSLMLKPGRHEYKYVVNHTDWITDPKGGETVADKYGGRSSVIDVK